MSHDIRQILKDRGLTVREFARLLNCSERQARYYVHGEKALSELEYRGLESLPRTRGRKKK